MRPSLSIKTLFRTPFKTLLTFFLLAAVTFALFSRVGEYSITSREIKNAAKEYRGIGSAEINAASESYPGSPFYIKADPRMSQDYSENEREDYLNNFRYQPLSLKQIKSIIELPYITSSSIRYMTAGISDKYYRLDDGGSFYNYTAHFVIEGTLSEVEYDAKDIFGRIDNKLILDDCTLLAGNLSMLSDYKKIKINAQVTKMEQGGLLSFSASGSDRTLVLYDESYIYDSDYIRKLTLGDRYVIVGRFEPLSRDVEFYIGDYLTDPWCEAVQSVEGQPENYLETGQFAPLRELIELTNADLHTFDVVYTDDMSSIMRFAQGDMAVTSGRELTKEDSIVKANVCVVSKIFASRNSLNLGDKITLRLGTELFEQYKGLGAVVAMPERYSPPERKVELEIVGIYIDTDGSRNQSRKPHWSYSVNTVFVPKSLLPLDEDKLDEHVFSPSEFSFTVGNAWDIPSFIENGIPMIKDMGLSPIFYDDGWPQIVDEFVLSTKLSVIAIIALSGAAIAAIGFVVFLFIGRKKKEYAVMRALGTTRKASAGALILPLMTLSVLAVLVGSCTAWVYTINTVARSNAALSKINEYAVNTSIPLSVAAGCIFSEISLLLLIASYGLWRIGAISPLMLLQNHQNKQRRSGKLTHTKTKVYAAAALPGEPAAHFSYNGKKPVTPDMLITGTNITNTNITGTNNTNTNISDIPEAVQKTDPQKACGHVLRYIAKHICRSAVKSILAILLSALLVVAVGQFAVMRQSYINLCNSIEIKARFLDGLPLTAAIDVAESDFIDNIYYEASNRADVNYTESEWVVTNDIQRYTGEETEIIYAKGYDELSMKELGEVCFVGIKLLEAYGLKPGDKIHVTRNKALENLQTSYIDRYKRQHPEEVISDEKILELCNEELMKEFMTRGSYYTIAGTVSTPSGKYDRMFFTPGNLKAHLIFRVAISLELAEFILDDNLHTEEFRSYAARVVAANTDKYATNRLTFYMDTSKLDDLMNTMTLLEKLYPVIVAAAVMIGGVICGLIIIQASREAAILRVLGTTRRRTRAILVIEQVFLCIIGLAAGACGLLLYNGASITEIAAKLYLFAALYFAGCLAGTLACSAITTHRNVLELLQTKE